MLPYLLFLVALILNFFIEFFYEFYPKINNYSHKFEVFIVQSQSFQKKKKISRKNKLKFPKKNA